MWRTSKPSQHLKELKVSSNLTFELSTFITKVLLIEVINGGKVHLQEWASYLRDNLAVDDGNIFVSSLYELYGQLHIINYILNYPNTT